MENIERSTSHEALTNAQLLNQITGSCIVVKTFCHQLERPSTQRTVTTECALSNADEAIVALATLQDRLGSRFSDYKPILEFLEDFVNPPEDPMTLKVESNLPVLVRL